MPTTRLLNKQDLPSAIVVLSKFREDAPVPCEFSKDVFIENWGKIMDAHAGVIIAVCDGATYQGFIGLLLSKDLNDGLDVAQEAFWFVDPEKRGCGIRLLKWAEDWAKNNGFSRILMGHLHNESGKRLSNLFQRMGYAPAEVTYVKVLK